jgi:hypothetical protein
MGHELADFAQDLLGGLVGGVGLAGEEQQDGALGVAQKLGESGAIAHQQGGAFVGGEAACESDREHIGSHRVQQATDVAKLCRAQAFAGELALQPFAHTREHARLDRLGRRPIPVVGNLLEAIPELHISQPITPFPTQLSVQEVGPYLMQERRDVHAVGDEPDGILFGANLGPLIADDPRAHDTVNPADPVHPPRAVQGEPGHIEQAADRRGTTEIEKAIHRDAELAHKIAEHGDHQIVRERVVAGRYRRMRRKHTIRCHRLQSRGERQTFRDSLAQQLENQKGRVPLVQVPYGRGNTERSQRARAADSEDHLLADAS